MSEITPEDVAYILATVEDDCVEDIGWPIVHAEGAVVHITVKPIKEDPAGSEPDEENAQNFRAVVVPVPAHAVADKPVKLPADLARELAYGDPGDSMEGYTVVANEYIEKRRWESVHWLVIRDEAGQHFADTYSRGLTEYQSNDPYENERQATFTPVAPAFKVATEWKFAKAKSGGAA